MSGGARIQGCRVQDHPLTRLGTDLPLESTESAEPRAPAKPIDTFGSKTVHLPALGRITRLSMKPVNKTAAGGLSKAAFRTCPVFAREVTRR